MKNNCIIYTYKNKITMNKTLIISIIILIIINLLTISYYSNKNKKLSTENYNLIVQQDTIKKSFNRLTKEYEYSKTSYAVEKASQLKQYNNSLYNQTKQHKNTAVAIQSTASVTLPSQQTNNTVSDTTHTYIKERFNFLYSDSSIVQQISGFNTINRANNQIITNLDTNKTTIKLKYSILKDKKGYKVQAFTSSKYLNISDLDAVYIENKPQNRWNVGLFMGYGINSNIQLTDFRVGWSAGVGVNYRLF